VGSDAVLKIQLDGVNIPNRDGILLVSGSSGSTIRGLAIYRFAGSAPSGPASGIRMQISTGNVVTGNYIGTDATGAASSLGNSSGITMNSNNHTIGGTTPQERNVISGNIGTGVRMDNTGTTSNVVTGNYLGTDATGTQDRGNSGDGVLIQAGAASNRIGGVTAGERNIISGNSLYGITIDAASNNLVQGNYIGADVNGANLGNNFYGVEATNGSNNNTIGGTAAGAGNRIAFNGSGGVYISFTSTNNLVSQNAVFSNTSLGIDLNGNGVTANDAGDGDTGGNNFQNYPVLSSALIGAGITTVTGSLNSTANTTFTLEFFSNAANDPSGFGEGETYQGSTTVTTDGTGNVNLRLG